MRNMPPRNWCANALNWQGCSRESSPSEPASSANSDLTTQSRAISQPWPCARTSMHSPWMTTRTCRIAARFRVWRMPAAMTCTPRSCSVPRSILLTIAINSQGPLRFVFQPAEERVPGGALDVIRDHGIDGVDAIVGIHCEPKLDAGMIGLKSGSISSAADMVCITLTGPGGHTARPELTVDLLTIAAQVITELPRRVQAALPADAEIKIIFGAMHGGDAANVIPTRCELRASIRTPTLEVWNVLPALVEECVAGLLAESGAGFEVDYTHGVPPVVNDAAITDLVARAVAEEFGADAIAPVQQSWGGDDFAWFTREVPGSYVRLGVHNAEADGPRLDLHAGHFDVDERAIDLGVRLLVATTKAYFEGGKTS